MLREMRREKEEEEEESFSLGRGSESELEEENSEDGSEIERGETEEKCQIIESRTRFVGTEKRNDGEERIDSNSLLKVSTGTLDSSNRSRSTNPDSFIDPLMAQAAHSPSSLSNSLPPSPISSFLHSSVPPSPRTPTTPSPFASSSDTPSPPKHDLTGRLLPSAPPPLLPFDIPPSPASRSPRKRFSSTKSFARSLSQRRKGREDDDTIDSSRSYWDSTMEMDQTKDYDTVNASPRRSRLRIPLPSPIPFPSNSSLSLPTPPVQSYSPSPCSASPRHSSYFSLPLHDQTPSARTPTSSSFQLSPHPSSPTIPTSLHLPPSTRRHSNLPTPLSPLFPLPPPSVPPSASSSSFPLPPSYPQTPTSTSHEDHSFLYPPPSTPVPNVPKFVSVFINPEYENSEPFFLPSASESSTTRLNSNRSLPHSLPSMRRRNFSLSANHNDNSDEVLDNSKRRTMEWLNEVSFDEGSISKEGTIGSSQKVKKRVRIQKEGWMKRLKRFRKSRRGRWVIIGGILGVVLLAIVVGVIEGMKRGQEEDLGECQCQNRGEASMKRGICMCDCEEGWGGTVCGLNATCVEVGTERIAQGFLELARSTSSLWSPSIDVTRLAYTLNHYVHPHSPSLSSKDCSSQLSLVEIPSLAHLPTRLSFAQSALLHTLALTESNTTHHRLQSFLTSLDFSQFSSSDSRIDGSERNSNFQIISGGFTWDFSSLERLVQAVKWESLAEVNEEALMRIGGSLEGLEKATGFAVASHAQRGEALKHYWSDTLGREEGELERFKEKVRTARVVVPLEEDVSGVDERIRRRNDSLSIVEGMGCRNGLSEEMIERIDEVENRVFGLPRIDKTGSADCLVRAPLLSASDWSLKLR